MPVVLLYTCKQNTHTKKKKANPWNIWKRIYNSKSARPSTLLLFSSEQRINWYFWQWWQAGKWGRMASKIQQNFWSPCTNKHNVNEIMEFPRKVLGQTVISLFLLWSKTNEHTLKATPSLASLKVGMRGQKIYALRVPKSMEGREREKATSKASVSTWVTAKPGSTKLYSYTRKGTDFTKLICTFPQRQWNNGTF